MSCEIVNPAMSIAPNGCATQNNRYPRNCLSEYPSGPFSVPANSTAVVQYSLDEGSLFGVDLLVDIDPATAGIDAVFITNVTYSGNAVYPKRTSQSAASVAGTPVQNTGGIPLRAFSREAVYWFGNGPLGTGTPLAAILRAAGSLDKDQPLAVTVQNDNGAAFAIPNMSLVMAEGDRPAATAG